VTETCEEIVIDSEDLLDRLNLRYKAPQICIDFTEDQEKCVEAAYPDKSCDFAIIDRGDLERVMRYMAPPQS
jgi:hypothetical protein